GKSGEAPIRIDADRQPRPRLSRARLLRQGQLAWRSCRRGRHAEDAGERSGRVVDVVAGLAWWTCWLKTRARIRDYSALNNGWPSSSNEQVVGDRRVGEGGA